MSEQPRPLAGREVFYRATDTRKPRTPDPIPAPTDPSPDLLTLTILGVVLFVITTVVLVARTLYSTGP